MLEGPRVDGDEGEVVGEAVVQVAGDRGALQGLGPFDADLLLAPHRLALTAGRGGLQAQGVHERAPGAADTTPQQRDRHEHQGDHEVRPGGVHRGSQRRGEQHEVGHRARHHQSGCQQIEGPLPERAGAHQSDRGRGQGQGADRHRRHQQEVPRAGAPEEAHGAGGERPHEKVRQEQHRDGLGQVLPVLFEQQPVRDREEHQARCEAEDGQAQSPADGQRCRACPGR